VPIHIPPSVHQNPVISHQIEVAIPARINNPRTLLPLLVSLTVNTLTLSVYDNAFDI